MTIPPTASPADSLEHSPLAIAVAGQYRLERELGRGGMGVVYLARDLKLDRQVAVKTLLPHLAGDPAIRERFLREARTAGALSHQNIVPVHRADELNGQVFFVMGFVDGVSMAQNAQERGRLAPRDTAVHLRDVADALGYAHSRGIVHRDVKLENILIDRETGRAMVTDFGIARLSESAPLTSTGQLLGTVYYLSPEQISGEPVDGRSDIYSLGVAGFFALSGRFPFDAPLASAVVVAHVTKAPPPVADVAPGIPMAFASIIDRCLAKNPADRFPDCAALASALSEVVSQLEHSSMPAAQRGPKLSDAEAQAVWERAAQLQAQTGVIPRPAPVPIRRDAVADAQRTSGFQLGDIRAAASEALIPSQYVEHALAERGLADSAALQHRTPEIRNLSTGGKWVGAPTLLEYEIILDGEVASSDFDLLGDVIQRTAGSIGTLTEVGRSLSWQEPDHIRLQVTVFARDGKTTIRAQENIRPICGGLLGGIVGGGGGALGMPLFVAITVDGAPLLGAAALVGLVGGALALATSIFGSVSKRRQARLRTIVERLADHARGSIDASRPKRIAP